MKHKQELLHSCATCYLIDKADLLVAIVHLFLIVSGILPNDSEIVPFESHPQQCLNLKHERLQHCSLLTKTLITNVLPQFSLQPFRNRIVISEFCRQDESLTSTTAKRIQAYLRIRIVQRSFSVQPSTFVAQ